MLSRENRFSLKTDRIRIEKDGQTVHSRLFTLILAPREKSSLPTRFAILVSKKTIPLSVNRHRLKRLISEVLRHNLSLLTLGLDIILIPKRSIFEASTEQILSDLFQTLKP